MTEKDVRTLYQRETGEYAPEPYQQDTYDRDYIRWLEEQVIRLSEPVVIQGEPLRKTMR